MKQIINNEISNIKSVQILRAEQTLESSIQRGGVKMTNKQTMSGSTINGGNEMKSMQQILTELMEKFGDKIPAEQLVKLAEQEFAAIVELAKMAAGQSKETVKEETKVEEKEQKAIEEEKEEKSAIKQPSKKEDGMDKFMGECYQLVTSRAAITAKVIASLIYKYVDKYGDSVDNVARYMAAFFDYYTTEGGEKHVKRLGWDVILILGAQLGKNLAGDWEVIADIIEGGETVLKYKTGADLLRAGWGGVKYAKKNKANITNELLEYGSKQKLTAMAFATIDELMDQE